MFPFEADPTSDVPLWAQLRQRLIYLISSGHFKPGDQLPTVRGLASEISINYNTVNKAYISLVSDGYLESTRGRGVFVRDIDADMDDECAGQIDGIIDDAVAACRELGMSLDDVHLRMDRKIRQMKAEERMRASAGKGKAGGRAEGETCGSNDGRIVRIDIEGAPDAVAGANSASGSCGA